MSISTEQLFGITDEHITWLSKQLGVHHAVLPHFEAMQQAAEVDGIEIKIASGFRSFERQLSIWNRKVSGELITKDIHNTPIDLTKLSTIEQLNAILLYSALPATSRHHWGTDIDVYSPSLLPENTQLQLEPWEYQPGGHFEKLTLWLTNNAYKFGFYMPYQCYNKGVAIEPWHLSYAPLAVQYKILLKDNVSQLTQLLADSSIALNNTVINNIDYIMTQYVLNISQADINNMN